MIAGRLKIDGKDAYTEYGAFVVKGGLNEVVAMPPLKPFESNDWHEYDGLDADLSAPVLNAREISLRIAHNDYRRFSRLVSLLREGGYHTFFFVSIGRTYRLRLVAISGARAGVAGLESITMKFAEDQPMTGYTYKIPNSTIATTQDYTLDGKPLSDYGVRILKGTIEEILRLPSVKENLTTDSRRRTGITYDTSIARYKSKDVKLYCLMRAESLNELWRNYDALLYDLIRPEARTLGVEILGREFRFAYKNCQVTEFYPTEDIWLKFTLTITFI